MNTAKPTPWNPKSLQLTRVKAANNRLLAHFANLRSLTRRIHRLLHLLTTLSLAVVLLVIAAAERIPHPRGFPDYLGFLAAFHADQDQLERMKLRRVVIGIHFLGAPPSLPFLPGWAEYS